MDRTIGPPSQNLTRHERRRARLEDLEMIARTSDALGLLESKWNVDVIFLLASGMHRHARLVDNIPGLSKKVLTATLRKLERNGVVKRRVYAEIPVRVEYTLTPFGWGVTELLMTLHDWALDHEDELAALTRADRAAGAATSASTSPRSAPSSSPTRPGRATSSPRRAWTASSPTTA
jgi:DNA-binding HxlR family transcriptional regulator